LFLSNRKKDWEEKFAMKSSNLTKPSRRVDHGLENLGDGLADEYRLKAAAMPCASTASPTLLTSDTGDSGVTHCLTLSTKPCMGVSSGLLGLSARRLLRHAPLAANNWAHTGFRATESESEAG
jgi:hypothetical protein